MRCKHRILDNCKKDSRPCIFSEKCFEPELPEPMTRADRIRAMSDEELAAYLEAHYDEFCPNKPECGNLIDREEDIPSEWCTACALEWLRQPAEEDS